MTAVSVREADYVADYAAIRAIRFAVFVDEQGVPASVEMDERDPECIHVLAFVGDEAVGTGRLDVAKRGKVGRVAVLAAARGTGVGRALMTHLHEIARRHGLADVWCHAQVAAAPFYERLGYRRVGAVFEEAGIDHVRMVRSLSDAAENRV
ncbi:MAG TPA: GNAT family N-acetyltransferase [Gammaproteobacteria bacterium]